MRRCLLAAYILLSAAIVVPVSVNATLRVAYFNLLAHWRAKLIQPAYVFIGDSLTAGGGVWGWRLSYDPLSAINLGESGLVTWQIAERAKTAVRYHPKTIVVMAGTNDAARPIDKAQLTRDWENLFVITRAVPMIVILPPKTASSELNARLAEIEPIIRTAASEHGATVVDLKIDPRLTTDGVHLSETAYQVWAAKLTPVR